VATKGRKPSTDKGYAKRLASEAAAAKALPPMDGGEANLPSSVAPARKAGGATEAVSAGRNPARSREKSSVSPAAQRIATLLVAGMQDREMAAAQAQLWPAIVQATIDSAHGYSPAAMQARVQLLRWSRHPSATAADASANAKKAGASLADRLASRLAEAETGPGRHGNGTTAQAEAAEPPFPAALRAKRTS
jgi:hypothetical protein